MIGAPRPEGERHLVLGCELTHKPNNAPRTAIVKCAQQHENDIQVGGFISSDMLLNEWTSLKFLGDLDTETTFAPNVICGDIDSRLIVTEGIANAERLVEPILGEDSDKAEQSLISFARFLGKMHATTAGKSQDFERHLSNVGEPGPNDGEHRRRILAHLKWVLDHLELSPTPSFHDEVEHVLDAMLNTGPFLSFVHGDPCPDNVLISGSGIRLIDFENAGFKHALIEGVYGRLMFPSCWCAN